MIEDLVRQALLSQYGDKAVAIQTARASVFAKTDQGLVMVIEQGFLNGKTAGELRLEGFIVPNEIPERAVIRYFGDAGLAFCWGDDSAD